MDVIPVTAMLKGSYATTSGTSTFIIQRFWFPSPADGSAISEISQVPGYPIQIEQATGFGGQAPVWISEKQVWACGWLAIKPTYPTSYPEGCALPYPDPSSQPASPFPEWNLDDNLVSHNFKLVLDYQDWKVRAYIDGHIEGETGIMARDPYVVSFEMSYRTAPRRDFERIFKNIKTYYVE